MTMENYLSFDSFTAAFKRAPLLHFTSVGIIHENRRFWSKRLARHLGRRGKKIRYFLDTSGGMNQAVVFNEAGEFLDNVPEVGCRK